MTTSGGYLLDTNICIYIINAREKVPSLRTREETRVLQRFQREPTRVYTSEVSIGELVFGAERSARREKNLSLIAPFFGIVPAVPVTADVWRLFGVTKAQLQARGVSVQDLDLLIACVAQGNDLTLVSNDRGFDGLPADFPRENWTK